MIASVVAVKTEKKSIIFLFLLFMRDHGGGFGMDFSRSLQWRAPLLLSGHYGVAMGFRVMNLSIN